VCYTLAKRIATRRLGRTGIIVTEGFAYDAGRGDEFKHVPVSGMKSAIVGLVLLLDRRLSVLRENISLHLDSCHKADVKSEIPPTASRDV